MAVIIKRPALKYSGEFLRAVERSHELHRGLVSPPDDVVKFRGYVNGLRKENRSGFLVMKRDLKDMIGVINVSEIVRGCFQSAYLGYYAFAPFAGKGLMRQGMERVLGHCFEQLGLHRLEANIQPQNVRSISLVRGLGFRLEGLSMRYLKVCGEWRDHERWALLSEEWRGGEGE